MTLSLDRELAALDLDLTILEAEATVRDLEKARGLIPAQASRPMSEAEIRSHCDFAAMDATTTRAYQETAAALRPLRMAILAALEETARNAPTPEALAKAVLGFAANQPAAVRSAVRVAESRIARVLADLHGEAGQALTREAQAQGITGDVVTAATADDYQLAAAKAPAALWAGLAAAAVNALATRATITQAKAGEVDRTLTLDGLLALMKKASPANAEDLARQEVNIAHGEGRSDAVAQLPTPTVVYASELLDGATCDPCAAVDGREYASVDDANRDYPSDGPYRDCKGGDRCRGTLVYVWDEQPATVDDNPLTPAPAPAPIEKHQLPQNFDPKPPPVIEKHQLVGSFEPKVVKKQLTGSFAPKPKPVSEVKQLTGSFAPKPPPVKAVVQKPAGATVKIGKDGKLHVVQPTPQPQPTPSVATPAVPKPVEAPPAAAPKPATPKPAPKPKATPKPKPATVTEDRRTFKDHKDGRGWASKVWPGREGYTGEQLRALEDYTEDGYKKINGALRASKGKRGGVRGLNSAFTAAPRVPEPIIVTRGAGSGSVFGLPRGELGNLTDLVGKEFVEHGYMSTSVDAASAFGDTPIQMRIAVPKGYKAIYVSGDNAGKGVISAVGGSENELILDKGARFVITNAVRKKGQWIVDCDIV